jgi:hypothetical protein
MSVVPNHIFYLNYEIVDLVCETEVVCMNLHTLVKWRGTLYVLKENFVLMKYPT